MTLTDLSLVTGISTATVYRLLVTLERRGFVRNEALPGLWFIGVETFRAGAAFARALKVPDASREPMRELMSATGETANVAVEEAGDVLFLAQVECHEAVRAFFRPGTRGWMHASGIGKALLAMRSEAAVASLVAGKGLPAFTDKTLVNPDELAADLALTRQRGWALDDEERSLGMRCIAAPVFDIHGEAVAGVSISGPTVRMHDGRLPALAADVVAAAARITRSIGGGEQR